MEIQQSSPYRRYLQALGWKILPIEKTYLVVRHFPIIGTIAKLQRCNKLPSLPALSKLIAANHIRTLSVEPSYTINQKTFSRWTNKVAHIVGINKTPNLATKTIRVNLVLPEEYIFNQFSEAKRRAVRRAQKSGVIVNESTDINALLQIKNKSAGFLGFITTYGTDKLWPLFSPDHAAILLAHRNSPTPPLKIRGGKGGVIIGGVLLLFWDDIAYYWIAGATHEGKKLFAPTLLVWEALKLSKKHGMKTFDFIGVWDERIPKENKEWLGFTKFKEGFGGREVYYPIFSKRLIPGSLSK